MSIEQHEHERRRPSLLRPLRPRLDVRARRLRRGVYLLPSMFTMANLFCGYACIVHSMRQELSTAALFIGFAFVLDMLDGRIARMTGTTSAFGLEFDSLADVVSFGVAPAILSFQWGCDDVPAGWPVMTQYFTLNGGAAQGLGPKGLGRLHAEQIGSVDQLVDVVATTC